jgi:cyclic pyranopterin phosphate synthase
MYSMNAPAGEALVDGFGRKVDYLRLSITDRCNLRCFYCRPVRNFRTMSHADMLSYEEYLRIIGLALPLGLAKIRLTGGEPLLRRGFMDFLEKVMGTVPGMDVRLTTNATLLPGRAKLLAGLGLKAVNISLDSLKPTTFSRITGRDMLPAVRRAIEECLEAGLRVKINVVALQGVNDGELPDFLRLARELSVDVRFIEFMPIGENTRWDASFIWPGARILEKARQFEELTPEPDAGTNPARMWRLAGSQGRLGIISSLTGHFCANCNRLRLTSDGRLRPCLYSDVEYRLRPLMRSPKISDDHLRAVIRGALSRKPLGHRLLEERGHLAVCGKLMSSIGG